MSSNWAVRTGLCMLAVAATAGVVGCAEDGAGGGQAPNSPNTHAAAQQAERLTSAGKTATDAVPDSTLISIESERDGELWEVQVVTADGTEHEFDVSGSGSEVLGEPTAEKEDQQDKAKHQRRVQAAAVEYQRAAEGVLSAVSDGAEITELNLDTEHGTTVWEADVYDSSGVKHEVTLDASSGEVLANKTD